MFEFHPEYIVDERSNKKALVILMDEWNSILEEMEELNDILELTTQQSWRKERLFHLNKR